MASLNYREAGSGQPVVLIHGFPMNLLVWESLAEKLAEKYHVITPDLPGFGKSSGLPEGFTIDDVAASMLRFLTERNVSRPVIVGHSLGGYVTLAMAARQHGYRPSSIGDSFCQFIPRCVLFCHGYR